MSGIEMRSGFRNRSKSNPYLIGSTLVMPRQYAAREPADDPRPGPTAIPCRRACAMKSHTTRKYPENPIFSMTPSSKRRRSTTASAGVEP